MNLDWGEPWHTSHRLVYLRKDLLEKILQEKHLKLVWGVWGERGFKSRHNIGLDAFVKKHPAHKVFQKIVTYPV
jgi:hypothetical protein